MIWVVRIIRWIVGGLFIYAGALKAGDPAQFIRDIWNYHLVAEPAAYWIAAFVPYLEIVAGIALITGLQRRGAHLIIGSMLVVFIAFLVSAWARGLEISCGCFGTATPETTNYPWLITRDLLLFAGVVVSAIATRRPTQATT